MAYKGQAQYIILFRIVNLYRVYTFKDHAYYTQQLSSNYDV